MTLPLELLDRLPGLVRAMPRMCSFASDSHCVGMRAPLEGRVRPEDLEKQRPLRDLAQRRRDDGRVAMALEIHEDHVLPGPPLGRARFDLREVDPQPRQRPRGSGRALPGSLRIAKRIDVLSRPVGPLGWRPMIRKRVELCGLSSSAPARSARRRARPRARRRSRRSWRRWPPSRRPGPWTGPLRWGPRACARRAMARHCPSPLRVREDTLDLRELSRPREELLGDVQAQLAANDHLRVDEPIVRDVDGAVGAVLHRHDSEVGPPSLHVVEHPRRWTATADSSRPRRSAGGRPGA